MKEIVKGSLSSASLSGLAKSFQKQQIKSDDDDSISSKGSIQSGGSNSGSGKNYWEWKETIKKTLSQVNLNVGSKTRDTEEDATDEPAPKNYWFWRNSFRSKSDLEAAAKEAEGEKTVEGESEEQAPKAGGGYWFWRNPSFKSLSGANLEKLGKDQSSPDDSSTGSGGKPRRGGPISNLDHKLRTSWRNSFKTLSNNSLSKLDEGHAEDKSGMKSWRSSFKDFQSSFSGNKKQAMIDESDDPVVEESSSNDDSDNGITF